MNLNSSSSRISYISYDATLTVVCVHERTSEMRFQENWEQKNPEIPVLMPGDSRRRFYLKIFFSLLFGNVFFMNLYCASFFIISGWERIKGNWISWREKKKLCRCVHVTGYLLARNPSWQVLFVIIWCEWWKFQWIERKCPGDFFRDSLWLFLKVRLNDTRFHQNNSNFY